LKDASGSSSSSSGCFSSSATSSTVTTAGNIHSHILPGNGGVFQQINDERTQSDIDDQSEDESDLAVVAQRENAYIDPILQDLETPFPWNDDNWEEYDVRDISSRVTRTSEYVQSPLPSSSKSQRMGPRNIPEDCRTESDFMELFFTDDIMRRFVDNTNSYNRNRAKLY
jgi:hypothetical protein